MFPDKCPSCGSKTIKDINLTTKKEDAVRRCSSEDYFCEKISIESTLLFSGGWENFCDKIWFVESSEKNIKLRLTNFRGMREDKVDSILELQSFIKQNKKQVDQVIINNKNLLNLEDIIKRKLKVV